MDAVKIGAIANEGVAEAVADALSPHPGVPVVVDPVMIAKGGASLLAPEAVDALIRRLLPLATLLTPNLPEAAALLHGSVAEDRTAMADQSRRLRALGPQCVLVKGGHLSSDESPDALDSADRLSWFEGTRILTQNTHGTGCTLSSAVAAEIAKGVSLQEAVALAKRYVTGAVAAADRLSVGSGRGPVQQFHEFWKDEDADAKCASDSCSEFRAEGSRA